MSDLLPVLLLTSALSGEAALRHAAALAALGPHPMGSPRNHAAAEYVAAEFRDAGLGEVRLEDFESQGTRGANVVGVLRAPGAEFLVIGAHHDTAPDAPGAYDDGAGVGLLIEAARALEPRTRTRTLVFVSFDGGEATIGGRTPGSRAYIRSLGSASRDLVAAFVVEMCGWKGGTPVLHPLPYPDPLRPGRAVIAPAWLVEATQEGARQGGVAFPVGDPHLSWLYQPTVRVFQVRRPFGDDLSFLQAGLPAVFVSDSSFAASYPWYQQSGDTADKLDAESLARMGGGVLGVIEALGRAPRGPATQPTWFSALGRVAGGGVLLTVAVVSLLPRLLGGFLVGGVVLFARLLQAAIFAVLLWRQPVPALFVFLLPNLIAGLGRPVRSLLSLLPALALVGLGVREWTQGFVVGIWLAPWEVALLVLGLALLFSGPPSAAARRTAPRRGRSTSTGR